MWELRNQTSVRITSVQIVTTRQGVYFIVSIL